MDRNLSLELLFILFKLKLTNFKYFLLLEYTKKNESIKNVLNLVFSFLKDLKKKKMRKLVEISRKQENKEEEEEEEDKI